MGIELEWFSLLVIRVFGNAMFGRFEVETPAWKRIAKWLLTIAITGVIYHYFGHWAMVFVIGFSLLGLTVHFVWCKKNGIHPFRATPHEKYRALRATKQRI